MFFYFSPAKWAEVRPLLQLITKITEIITSCSRAYMKEHDSRPPMDREFELSMELIH